nr:putative reverse transcriptase domain-containing protein [Tanacetum cinerariifolium]
FGKRGKLNPRYVGPFKVLERIGDVAYKLDLPEELSRVHNTLDPLKKCHADEPLVVPLDGLHFDDKLQFVEEPVEIMDREVKRLKQSRIPLVKIRWNSKRGPETTAAFNQIRVPAKGRAYCDLLINNVCERIVIVQKVIQKCDGPLTPVVAKLFDKIKVASTGCVVEWNGSELYQDISGIPCKHVIAAIHDMTDNGYDVGIPEDWVHDSYKLQTWMNVYSHKVNPVNVLKKTTKTKRTSSVIGTSIAAAEVGTQASQVGTQASSGPTFKRTKKNASRITPKKLNFMEYLMKRIVIVQKVIQKCDGPLTPVVAKLFDKIKVASSGYVVEWNGSELYQDISGIPCKHAIAVIHDMTDNGYDVNPVNGRDVWSKYDCPTTLLPPKVHPLIGRPPKKRKKSKRKIVMVKGNKLTRQVLKKTTKTKRTSSVIGTSITAAEVGTQASQADDSSAFLDLNKPAMIATARAYIRGSTQEKIGQLELEQQRNRRLGFVSIHDMFNGRVDMLSLYIRCSTNESICYRCTLDVQRMSRYVVVVHKMFNSLRKIILDVNFYIERRTSPSTGQFSWSFNDSKLFSRTFNTSKLFSRTFNTSKLFSKAFKKCRVLKLQALAWEDNGTRDDPMPPGIEDDDDDSERDILILKDLPRNYSISLPEIESYHFDIPSFSRPHAKPPDVYASAWGGSSSEQHTHQPTSLITGGFLNEKEYQQLLQDEEVLRETLEEQARAEKELEEKIKKEQAEYELFTLEFRVQSDSEYESD